jgi:hypothetical protein
VAVDNTSPKRSPAAIARWEREKSEQRALQREALELRQAGYSFRRIAEIQGCSVRTAATRHRKACRREVPEELIVETRKVELDRYDTLTLMNMKLLAQAFEVGDIEAFCKIQDRINAVHDRRAKMIPIQVPVTMVIDQKVDHTTDQDRELSTLLGQAAQDVEDKIRWLNENTESRIH